MITYNEISPPMRAFAGAFIALRKLGFRANDIYFGVFRSARHNGALSVFCILKTQGKAFNYECALVMTERAACEVEREYKRVSAAMSKDDGISQSDLDRLWKESEAYRFTTNFVLAVMSKGIEIPNPDAN
jgi:hypothetical protein